MTRSFFLLIGLSISAAFLGSQPAAALSEWEEFCLMTSEPGEDIDECLTWGEVGQDRSSSGRNIMTTKGGTTMTIKK